MKSACVHLSKCKHVIGPICPGYVPFHSVEFVLQQLSSFSGLLRVACLTDMFRDFEVAHLIGILIPCEKILVYGKIRTKV